MPTPMLSRAFDDARVAQAEQHANPLHDFDRDVGRAVLQGAALAMRDVVEDRSDKVFRYVSAPTGSGKSCSAAAVIAAATLVIPEFTCAYVVQTVRQVDETGVLIRELVGDNGVTVWTNAHNAKLDEEERALAMEEHGTLHMPSSYQGDLKAAKVIVVTHALWKREMVNGVDKGVRCCNGKRRSVIFVDEHPDLTRIIERTPGDITKLRDRIFQVDPDHGYIPVLETIIERTDEAFKSTGVTYSPAELISCLEAIEFYDLPSMRPYVDRGVTEATARAQASDMEETCRFIVAAAKGCVFISRSQYPTLVAYEFEFEPGPGHVLLDATADLTGMTGMMAGMEKVPVQDVDFSNLEVFHLEQPKQFKRVDKVLKLQKTTEQYAAWVKEQVLANTEAGDDVLVVSHKGLLTHGYLPRTEDPEHPVDWQGRTVNIIHWGVGIGSNKYKAKTVVFLFGEFWKPRKVAVADSSAWRDRPPTKTFLAKASQAVLTGDVLTANDGNVLRWSKQLACRGRVRNIDAGGKCGEMKLYTSMDFDRLIQHLDALFPGCHPPTCIIPEEPVRLKKVDRLCRLLASTSRGVLWSDEIAKETGVEARHLSRTVLTKPKITRTMERYGWTLVSAKDLGEPGKRKALARLAA